MTREETKSGKPESNYARFRRVAKSIKVPDEDRALLGDDFFEVLKNHAGPLVPRRAAKRFAQLSDDELLIACKELKRFIRTDPSGLLEITLHFVFSGLEAVHHASIIAFVLPTYRKLSSDNPAKEFVFVEKYDERHASPSETIFGRFSTSRINGLHGAMMQAFTPEQEAIPEEDIEWFGENRDAILPIWGHIFNDGAFTRQRVQVLLSELNGGVPPLIEGAL